MTLLFIGGSVIAITFLDTKMLLCSCFGLFKIKKFLPLEFLNSFKLLPFYVLILTEPYFLAFLHELHLRHLQRTGDAKQNR